MSENLSRILIIQFCCGYKRPQWPFFNSGKVGIAKAKELAFTARMIGGNEAASLGLVNRCGKYCFTPSFLRKQNTVIFENGIGDLSRTFEVIRGNISEIVPQFYRVELKT